MTNIKSGTPLRVGATGKLDEVSFKEAHTPPPPPLSPPPTKLSKSPLAPPSSGKKLSRKSRPFWEIHEERKIREAQRAQEQEAEGGEGGSTSVEGFASASALILSAPLQPPAEAATAPRNALPLGRAMSMPRSGAKKRVRHAGHSMQSETGRQPGVPSGLAHLDLITTSSPPQGPATDEESDEWLGGGEEALPEWLRVAEQQLRTSEAEAGSPPPSVDVEGSPSRGDGKSALVPSLASASGRVSIGSIGSIGRESISSDRTVYGVEPRRSSFTIEPPIRPTASRLPLSTGGGMVSAKPMAQPEVDPAEPPAEPHPEPAGQPTAIPSPPTADGSDPDPLPVKEDSVREDSVREDSTYLPAPTIASALSPPPLIWSSSSPPQRGVHQAASAISHTPGSKASLAASLAAHSPPPSAAEGSLPARLLSLIPMYGADHVVRYAIVPEENAPPTTVVEAPPASQKGSAAAFGASITPVATRRSARHGSPRSHGSSPGGQGSPQGGWSPLRAATASRRYCEWRALHDSLPRALRDAAAAEQPFPPRRMASWGGAPLLCSLLLPEHHPALVVEERVERLLIWANALLSLPEARENSDVQAFFTGRAPAFEVMTGA